MHASTNWVSMIYDAIWKKVDAFKDHTFTQGFRDQTPGSEGLRRVIKTIVPAHAIACAADDKSDAVFTIQKPLLPD